MSNSSQRQGRRKLAVRGLLATYGAFPIRAGLRLVVTPLYLARLGGELLGLTSFVGEFLRYLNLVSFGVTDGLAAVVARSSARDDSTERDSLKPLLETGAQLQYLFGLTAFFICGLFSLSIERFAKGIPADSLSEARLYILLAGGAFGLTLASGVYKALLTGRQMIAENVLYGLASTVILTAVGAGLVLAGLSIIALGIASLLSAAWFFWQTRWRVHRMGFRFSIPWLRIDPQALKTLAGLGGWVTAASIGGLLQYNSARIVLGATPGEGMASVNKFALLVAVPTMLRLQANRIPVVARPGLTQLVHTAGGKERARQVAYTLAKVMGWVGATAFIGIWLVNPSFICCWVGSVYYAGDMPNILVASFTALAVWTFAFKVSLETLFQFKARGVGFLLAGVVTVVLACLLVPGYGIAGVAAASLVGEGSAAGMVFLPRTVPWLLGPRHRLARAAELVWGPMAIVTLGIAARPFLEGLPVSWYGVVVRFLLILGVSAVVGFAWLAPDIRREILRQWGRDA